MWLGHSGGTLPVSQGTPCPLQVPFLWVGPSPEAHFMVLLSKTPVMMPGGACALSPTDAVRTVGSLTPTIGEQPVFSQGGQTESLPPPERQPLPLAKPSGLRYKDEAPKQASAWSRMRTADGGLPTRPQGISGGSQQGSEGLPAPFSLITSSGLLILRPHQLARLSRTPGTG